MDSETQEPSENDEQPQKREERSGGFTPTNESKSCNDSNRTAVAPSQVSKDREGLSVDSEAVSDLRIQANSFLSHCVEILSKYVNKDCNDEAPYSNGEELRHTTRNIAITLTNADPGLKASILTLLSESSELLLLLALFIRQQFNGKEPVKW